MLLKGQVKSGQRKMMDFNKSLPFGANYYVFSAAT